MTIGTAIAMALSCCASDELPTVVSNLRRPPGFGGEVMSPNRVDRAQALRTLSRQVHAEPFEIGKPAVSQCSFMGGAQDDAGRLVCFEGFLPTRCT
jgi:hypothetical protein